MLEKSLNICFLAFQVSIGVLLGIFKMFAVSKSFVLQCDLYHSRFL